MKTVQIHVTEYRLRYSKLERAEVKITTHIKA